MTDTPSNHPGDETLLALSLGQLTEPELAHVFVHLDECPACCQRIDQLDSDDRLLARLQQIGSSREDVLVTPAQRGLAVRALRKPHDSTSVRFPPVILPAPEQIGDYDILAEVGRGGMGVVYKARHRGLNRLVALKMVLAGEFASPSQELRFRLEAELAARVQHANIVQVYEIGSYEGRPFLALEWVEGGSLANRLDGKPWPAAEAAALIEILARAIDAAHSEGVIHRDLKPANILMQRSAGRGQKSEVRKQKSEVSSEKSDGKQANASSSDVGSPNSELCPKITDFGLARTIEGRQTMTLSGLLVGTPGYMAPEQADGKRALVGPATDIYALGAMLYQLITGRLPFQADSTLELLRAVAADEPTRPRRLQPRLPRDLEAITLHCLEKEPARRYPSALALAEDLRRFQAGEVIAARPPSQIERVGKFVRRHKALVGGAVATGLALVLGTVFSLLFAFGEAKQRRELVREQAKVQARFDLAAKAIALFHTGVSEDMLLKNAEFKELRTKLLKEAAGFYAELEKLLAGQTDLQSRRALAGAYFELGELTYKIGDRKEALAVHRKALELRRGLAETDGADEETRLGIARSLDKVGGLLRERRDYAGALVALEEQRELSERLAAEHPTDAVESMVAESYHNIGRVQSEAKEPEEALASTRKALAIRQKLADAKPSVTRFQRDLAHSHHNMGAVLAEAGKPEEALESYGKALAIRQKLTDVDPSVSQFQRDLATTYNSIGVLLRDTRRPHEALPSWRKAVAIEQKLADANPAVTRFQTDVAWSHYNVGVVLAWTGKPEEALKYLDDRLQLTKAKLGPDHPATLIALDAASLGYLIVAAQQAWLGQEQEWATTCERGLSLARDTKNLTLADRVAKMCSLRPSNDQRSRAALLLARRAVELGKGSPYLPYFQMVLGMAEYRSGHFTEADAALQAAMKAGKGNPHIAGPSGFYRALSLFRQGKPDEARQLATQTAKKMERLLNDIDNLLSVRGDHDTLIVWLAYREAHDVIKLDQATAKGGQGRSSSIQ